MKRFSLAWCIRLALVTLVAACASTTEIKQNDKIYKAYSDTWAYSKTEIRTQYFTFDSPHGTLKKIECCQYFREKGDLYNIGDRLVFIFDNAREFITDCFIYPSGRPDNELKPPDQRIYGVTVFAEFDPQANVFKVSTFNASDNYLPFEYRAALLRSGRRDLTTEQHYAFLYAKRKAFMCEDFGPAPGIQATQSTLNMDAYQYGATRTLLISVAPAATDFVLDHLQRFALRKGFKTWKAGAAKGDVSLALQGEEILTIAAGNDAGLWRLAFYRRAPKPPSALPSEEKVDGLLREIKSELAQFSGVAFVD